MEVEINGFRAGDWMDGKLIYLLVQAFESLPPIQRVADDPLSLATMAMTLACSVT